MTTDTSNQNHTNEKPSPVTSVSEFLQYIDKKRYLDPTSKEITAYRGHFKNYAEIKPGILSKNATKCVPPHLTPDSLFPIRAFPKGKALFVLTHTHILRKESYLCELSCIQSHSSCHWLEFMTPNSTNGAYLPASLSHFSRSTPIIVTSSSSYIST